MSLRITVKEVDNSTEKLICTGLIVSDQVAGQLSAILDPKMLTAKYTQQVANWCLDYFKQFQQAPGTHIQDIYESAKREYLDEDVADLIETLLGGLSDHFVEGASFNDEYVLEEAEKYIKGRKALMLCEDVTALVSNGRILEAEGMLASYNIPKRPTADGDDVFASEFWDETEQESEVLFKFSGALHDLIGPIERDSFLSILAPEKRGKTWWLLFIALAAFRQRCNVAFFAVGDMTKKQVRRRIKHMLTARDPKRPKKTVIMPVADCYHNQNGECPLGCATDPIMLGGRGKSREEGTYEDFPEHQTCVKCQNSKRDAKYFFGTAWQKETDTDELYVPLDDACKAILSRSGHKRFKLFCYSNDSVSVSDINSQLDILQQQEGFIPDVIIIDYADNLMPEQDTMRQDFRHQENKKWQRLRKMSQDRSCCVFTATQAKSDARKRSQVEQWDTSEDKRKIGHVTGMIALNQTPAEKRKGIMRVSNLADRDSDFDTDANVQVLQCLALGKPYITSYWHKEKPVERKSRKSDEEE